MRQTGQDYWLFVGNLCWSSLFFTASFLEQCVDVGPKCFPCPALFVRKFVQERIVSNAGEIGVLFPVIHGFRNVGAVGGPSAIEQLCKEMQLSRKPFQC